ncbi:hypothetical protein BDB00DRAFT_827479 [Zychaea mexicana]|uniref:uncharacterized protein n=1 Tax=Zychaea mexicana TaxID=64656 RepID=UPI0022FDC524|nr:uncharacterized protein BDB00DRAFT_827479 [Zychaea mexicana]KAI9492642.1 hypothetical protein BDB00DRAFT_827479 [Zychaea mexicana]
MIIAISIVIALALATWQWLHSTIEPAPFGTKTYESQWSTLINTMIHDDLPAWVPTWFRVYAIGVVDTVATVLWKRIIEANTAEQLVRTYATSNNKVNNNSRLCIITGGDSGIGLEVARGLREAGLRVIIASRTAEHAQQAKAHLGDDVECLTVELTSIKSVRQFAAKVKRMVPKGGIDILINNAGIMNTPCHITSDGFDAQFQTNCLSPFYLSLLLLPWMNKKQGRILFAASSTLYAASPDLDLSLARKEYGWDGLTHYAHSKLYISVLSEILGQHLRDSHGNVQVFCYHPGAVRTNLFSHTTLFALPISSHVFDFIMLTPSEGAITPLYLCLAPASKLSAARGTKPRESGGYWSSTVRQPVPGCKNVEKAWKAALDFCGLTIPEAEALIRA